MGGQMQSPIDCFSLKVKGRVSGSGLRTTLVFLAWLRRAQRREVQSVSRLIGGFSRTGGGGGWGQWGVSVFPFRYEVRAPFFGGEGRDLPRRVSRRATPLFRRVSSFDVNLPRSFSVLGLTRWRLGVWAWVRRLWRCWKAPTSNFSTSSSQEGGPKEGTPPRPRASGTLWTQCSNSLRHRLRKKIQRRLRGHPSSPTTGKGPWRRRPTDRERAPATDARPSLREGWKGLFRGFPRTGSLVLYTPRWGDSLPLGLWILRSWVQTFPLSWMGERRGFWKLPGWTQGIEPFRIRFLVGVPWPWVGFSTGSRGSCRNAWDTPERSLEGSWRRSVLPGRIRQAVTVIRSPFVFKSSREQFEERWMGFRHDWQFSQGVWTTLFVQVGALFPVAESYGQGFRAHSRGF